MSCDSKRTVRLEKKGHIYIFSYEEGQENILIRCLLDLARDPESDFDHFDAGVLALQLGKRLDDKFEKLGS